MMYKKIFIFLLSFLLGSVSFSSEKYSFEKTEALKPLIQWRDYAPSTFAEANAEKKPIFMVLTAPSRCYWCQVYESEEYLFDPQVYTLINEKTIPVYVDADQRQDLTRKYLEWGWPSTTVMTPDGTRLFWYSGPRPIPNMIQNIENALNHVQRMGTWWVETELYTPYLVPEVTEKRLKSLSRWISQTAENSFDRQYGWFGQSKKFPQWRILNYFVDQYKSTKEEKRIDMVQLTLEQQYTSPDELETNYNLYDPIEWGFHRYGTTRNRDPPHYEKMLYDNVRLLNAYHNYWTTWLDDPYVNEVLAWTRRYLIGDYYDNEDWWFFANTDVNGEHAYYAKNPRPEKKARVEKTKYADRNADAMVNLLEIRKRQSEDMVFQTPTWPYSVTIEQLDMLINDTLKFLKKEMITKQWAFHYMTPEWKKWVRWSSIDHALLLLAFTQAVDVYGNKSYLKTAEQIADYSLEQLYDRYGWGFFERNSPDTHLYALGDHIDLSKPIAENWIFATALMHLSQLTHKNEYTIAAHDTVAWMANQQQQWWLDRWYYNMKAADEFLETQLIENLPSDIDEIRVKKQQDTWLNWYIDGSAYEKEFELSAVWLESYTHRWFWLFAILAFVAWLLSFLSPCTLPVLPTYTANILRSGSSNIVIRILWFMGWMILMFTVLGLSASAVWRLFHGWIERLVPLLWIWLLILWLLLLLWKSDTLSGPMMQWWLLQTQQKMSSSRSSVLLGMSMWLMRTPCVWPILLGILAVAWLQSQMWQGAVLLVIYGIWLSIPLLLVWLWYRSWIQSERGLRRLRTTVDFFWKKIWITTFIAGLLLIAVGLLSVFWGLDIIAARWAKSFWSWWLGEIERSLMKW